ncbi:MAG: hypothetical protein ACE5HK_03855 [Candidatus Methylomirabilales bacterium]
MGKRYGVRFDLWVSGRLDPQLVVMDKEEQPTREEIAACIKEKSEALQGKLFGSESDQAEVEIEYRSGVVSDQELLGRDPGFGVLCQEIKPTAGE